MCEMCEPDPDKKRITVNRLLAFADDLEKLAADYRSYATGIIKPHEKGMKGMTQLSIACIRRLVVDAL